MMRVLFFQRFTFRQRPVNRTMARMARRIALVLVSSGALAFLTLSSIFPWSAKSRHTLKRVIAKTEMRWGTMRGEPPRLISISGNVNEAGVEIEALDSPSGMATVTDRDGRFVLPWVDWYPGAAYDLVFSVGETRARLLTVPAPSVAPSNGVFDAGDFNLSRAKQVDRGALQGLNSISYEVYDSVNRPYYRKLYETLTDGKPATKSGLMQ